MRKILPPLLESGDAVGIASISFLLDRGRYQKGIAKIKARGYKILPAGNIHQSHGYFAGKDKDRAGGLNRLLKNKKLKGIVFTRGGYGASRLLDSIDYEVLRKNPKILMGFSDLTALFSAVRKKTGLICYYGPMVLNHAKMEGQSRKRAWLALEKAEFPDIEVSARQVLRHGKCEGEIIGGCLKLLSLQMGTDWDSPWKGKVLFLEDTHEDPFGVDRSLQHLKMAGKLDGLAGVVIGVIDDCKNRAPGRPTLSLRQIYAEIFSDFRYPVVYDMPFGHARFKYTFPIGGRAELDTKKRHLKMVL